MQLPIVKLVTEMVLKTAAQYIGKCNSPNVISLEGNDFDNIISYHVSESCLFDSSNNILTTQYKAVTISIDTLN